MGNTPDATDNGPQAPHMDWILEGSDVARRGIILALAAALSLLLYVGSHKTMLAAAKEHGWQDAEGGKEGQYTNSTPLVDEAFAWGQPFSAPMELELSVDHVLVMDHRLVHAGASSKLANGVVLPNLRMHWYVAPEGWQQSAEEELKLEDAMTTAPMECLHPRMHCTHLGQRFLDLSNRPRRRQSPQ